MTSEDEKNRVAQQSIAAAKIFGAKTAREAAEIVKGKPLSDDEWEKYKPAWERNWPLVLDPHPQIFEDGDDD